MLFPDIKRRGDIKFKIMKSMPYGLRILLAVILLVCGFAIQLLTVYAGVCFLLAASILMIVEGYDSRPTGLTGKREWRDASIEQLQQIVSMARKVKKWDQSLVDITCGTGFFALIVVMVAVGVLYVILMGRGEIWMADVLLVDSLALLVPHWVTGVRRILTSAPLTIKVDELLNVFAIWQELKREDEVMLCQIEVTLGEKGDMPCDAKLNMKIGGLADDFLGLQVQVVLNNVQGKDYPYLYCVLVARPEFGLFEKLSSTPPNKVMVEKKKQGDAHVLVVRQRTTGNSGYYTDRAAIKKLFTFALGEARKLS